MLEDAGIFKCQLVTMVLWQHTTGVWIQMGQSCLCEMYIYRFGGAPFYFWGVTVQTSANRYDIRWMLEKEGEEYGRTSSLYRRARSSGSPDNGV